MRAHNIIILLAAICAFLLPSPVVCDSSDVIVLTDSNFGELTQTGSWLLEFYAPWCGHCKTLAPTYEDAARRLRGSLNLAKIDATIHKELASRFDIKGFPSLRFYREGEVRSYNGQRTVDGIVSFGKEMTAPAVTSLSQVQEFESLTENHPVSAVFFGGKAGPERRLFDKMAYRLQGIVKFFSVDKSAVDVFTAIGAKPSDSPLVLIVTKNGDLDDSANRFTGEWTEGELRNFIVNNRLPLVNELDQHNFDDVTTSGKKIVYAIVNTKQPQQSAEFDKILYKLAKQSTFRDAFVFARLDGIKYHKYISQFGVVVGEGGSDVSSLPTMVVLDPALDYYYAPNGHGPNANIVHPIGGEREIQQFLTDILDGRIPLTGTTPWYNPTRYVRLLEKSLSKWPVWQVAVLAVIVMTAIVGSLFWCCFYGMDGEDFTIEAQQAAAAAIATTKKSKKKETLQSTNNFENTEADKEEDGIRQRKGKD